MTHASHACPSPHRVSLLVFLLYSIVFAQGKHIDLCAPATDRPWQRCSSSQKGLYNHLITRAVHQRGPWLALTVSASCIPARGWARDWSVLMASSRLVTCDSVSRARFTKVIGGWGGGVNAISHYLKSKSAKNHGEIRQKRGRMRGGGCERCALLKGRASNWARRENDFLSKQQKPDWDCPAQL